MPSCRNAIEFKKVYYNLDFENSTKLIAFIIKRKITVNFHRKTVIFGLLKSADGAELATLLSSILRITFSKSVIKGFNARLANLVQL